MSDEPVVPISAIEHWGYCARQCALIHVDGVWADNEHTVRGSRAHRRADSGEHRTERGRRVVRSIPLWSERLGLAGRADTVEFFDNGTVKPVEYKAGNRHALTAHMQVCAQALCLEEMLGAAVSNGAIWYGGTRRRETVRFDEDLRKVTVDTINAIRQVLRSGDLPSAPNDKRCVNCQLLNYCLPEVVGNDRRVGRAREELFR